MSYLGSGSFCAVRHALGSDYRATAQYAEEVSGLTFSGEAPHTFSSPLTQPSYMKKPRLPE